jgi:hypothetical protein
MKKSTIIAIAVFVLLLVGALAMLREKPERGITRVSFAEVKPDQVSRLEAGGKTPVKMTKDGDVWKLESGKRADGVAIGRLLEAIPKIQSSTVVTRNPERFAELEVDEEKGTTVIAAAGDRELARFTIGKPARGGSHVRVGETVYAVRGVFPSVFTREAGQWIEKKLFDVDREQVEKIEVSLADGTGYALVLKDAKWTLADPAVLPAGFRFDASQAESVANQVINARASEVLETDPGDEKTGLGGAVDTFTLVSKDGTRKVLRLGGESEQKNVYARADGWDEVVTLFPHSSRALRKRPTDMRDLGLMSFSPNDVVALEIENGDDKLRLERGAEPKTWRIASATEETPAGFALDQNLVEQRIVALRSSRAAAVAPEGARTGLDEPTAKLTATDDQGASVELVFGADTKQDERDAVFARGNADSEPYVVAKFTRDNLTGGLETFAHQEAPPGGIAGGPAGGLGAIDPAALQNLPPEVRQSLLQQLAQEQQKQKLLEQAGKAAQP